MDYRMAIYLVICIILVYLTCRFVLPLLVMVGLRKVLRINIHIGKIGLLSFYDVKIKLKPGLTVADIEEIQAAKTDEQLKNDKPRSRKKTLKKLFKKVSRFQFCGVHLEDLDVVITSSFIPESLLLVHLQHMHAESTVSKDRLNSKLELKELSYRVVQRGQPTGRSVSEGRLCISVVMEMVLIDGFLWPQEFDINLDNFESHIRKDISTRTIILKLRKVAAKGEFQYENGLEEVTGKMETKLFDLKIVSEIANILNLTSAGLQLLLLDSQITLKIESNGLFIGYHHEDVWPLVSAVDTMLLRRSTQRKAVETNPSPSKVKHNTMTGFLSKKSIEVGVNMDHSSFAIATSSCQGVKGGFVTARLIWLVKACHHESQKRLLHRDGRFEAELTSVYLKQADGGVSYTELQPKFHQWNCHLFVGTLYLRGNKLEQSVAVDTMIDSCQLEISTKLTLVTSLILGAVFKSLSGHLRDKETLLKTLKQNQQTAFSSDIDSEETCFENDDTKSVKTNEVDLAGEGRDHDLREEEGEFYDCAGTENHQNSISKTFLRHKMLKLSAPTFWSDIVESNRKVKKEPSKLGAEKLDVTWNLQISGVSAYFCHQHEVCCVLRVDSMYSDVRTDYAQLRVTDVKLCYLHMDRKGQPVLRCNELPKYHLYLKTLEGEYSNDQVKHKRSILVQFYDEFYMEWSMALHLCLLATVMDIGELLTTVRQRPVLKHEKVLQPGTVKSFPLIVTVEVKTHTSLALQLPEKHRVTFVCPGFEVKKKQDCLKVHSKQLVVAFDEQDLFTVEGIEISVRASCEQISLERRHLTELEATWNRTLTVRLESFRLEFPYNYNFDKCFRQLVGLNKWRKIVHRKEKKPFTKESPLPPDVLIQVQQVTVQLSDDPFEVQLGDNYELLLDENIEHARRVAALETKIPELRAKHGFLSASKIEELYATLNKKGSVVYIQRSRALYLNVPMRTKLMTLTIDNLEVMAMADKTLHGKDNCIYHMRDIDSSSPYPDHVVDYSTLFCRMVNVAATEVKIQLRDYPVPMLEVRDLHLWGRFLGAEEVGQPKARRTATIEVEEPWGPMTVTKNMPALKFFHDFSSDLGLWNMAYGPCWEPVISYVSLAMDLINKPSVDPSPSLPFWDKARLLLHGQLTMCVSSMSWRYHTSFDPYNKEEFMDWTWTDLVLDWTNAKWILKGDLDIYARTASKYDDCCVLHLPNLKLCVQLDWCCRGNPNAHHLVQPTAPEKIPVEMLNGWDTYKDFRSSNLNLEISFETKPQEGVSSTPRCTMYASIIRWLDRIKMCIDRVSRPIRKGKLFANVKPKKKSLSRHYKKLCVSLKVHKYEIHYWVSNVQKAGVEIHGHSFALLSGLEQSSISHPTDLSLVRRARSEWAVKQLGVEQNDVSILLCTMRNGTEVHNTGSEADSVKTDKECPLEKQRFLSVKTVLYQRAEETVDRSILSLEQSLNEEKDAPSHHVQVYELRGLWTPQNRNIVLSLYDGYRKASTLRKNLSTEALKGFKVDTQLLSPPRSSRPAGSGGSQSDVFTPSPASRLQAGPGYDMLQKLVSESDTKFIAVHEEISGGNVQVEQLTGVTACQRDDVVRKEWQVELYNSQVMLKGCETPGYVIVSAAKASILTCDHRPIWQDQQLRSKNTIVGSLDCMQYYATINPERKSDTEVDLDPGSVRMSHDEEDQPVAWLSSENIEDQQEGAQSIMGIEGMLGSGQMVGGIVNEKIEQEEAGQAAATTHVQLQRIISRCKCQIFYAGYGEVDDEALIEVATPCGGGGGSSGVMFQAEEGVDCLTLLHHDLNICTNSSQYEMILDIVNNLLLFVDSKQKEREERQQRLKFKLHLNSIRDQKTPVVHRQNQLRALVSKVRQLEREAYLIQREAQENLDDVGLVLEREELEKRLEDTKCLVNTASEELATLISAFKETQLQAQAELRATMRKDDALPVKVYEVCFKHAAWRMTEEDGQIGIADVMLRNFLYSKLNKDDDSGSHQMELGYLKVTNLLPDSTYKELLGLQEGGRHSSGLGPSERQTMLRVLCKFKAPVGGIPIKEHLEVNVLPVTLQLTKRFYNTAMHFFFPERKKDTSQQNKDSDVKKKRQTLDSEYASRWHVDDIDKMKERAAKNNVFLYVKIPEVPLTVSYKGLKDKNVTDVQNFQFVVPTLEYHSRTWTWLDLLLAMKNDCKRVLIAQAIKQKLHMRSRVAELCEMVQHGEALQEEQDKASMLLGSRVLGEKPAKKNLFGKSGKH